MDSSPSTRLNWIVAILLTVILAALVVPGLLSSQRASNERSASAMLKVLASVEADFRGNDRDKNDIQDFWTANVSGLFDFVPPGAKEPMQLISPDLAKADPTRPGSTPLVGYRFVAMDKDGEGHDYRQGPGKDRHPSNFGFSAYPANYGRHAVSTFYIDDMNTVLKEDLKGRPRLHWPSDSDLKERYSD